MNRCKKAAVYLFLLAAFFLSTPLFSEEFKSYTVGIDTGYTVFSLFYSGFGAGIYGEAVFGGTFSFAANAGYLTLKTGDTNSLLVYTYAGVRYYTTFNAIEVLL